MHSCTHLSQSKVQSSFYRADFWLDKAKSAGILFVWRAFLTQYKRKSADINRMRFNYSVLKKYYSETNPKGAYAKIKRFLTKKNFSHEQYSGYHSKYKTTDLEIFDLIDEMSTAFPWLANCVNHFEVTNIGANHDLMELFAEDIDDPV